MQPFTKHTGLVASLDRENVDTDQIIPAPYLKRTERTGFGQFLFDRWRRLPDGSPNPQFELNRPEFQGATILLVGRNFGCGSSREHAPWALGDYGFRVIIASSFADIFYNNCFQNGLLPVTLDAAAIGELMRRVASQRGYQLTVDLESCRITDEQGLDVPFEVDPFRRHCLLGGLGDIDLTEQHADKIAAYEASRGMAPLPL